MSPQSPMELLENLRADLKQVEEAAQVDLRTIAHNRQKLLRRIADVERIVRLATNRNQ